MRAPRQAREARGPGGPGVGARPPHRDPALLALVAAGGAVGTAARHAVATALPTADGGWPLATLAVNVLGAFLLGVLLEALLARGPETRRVRAVRLALGTGALGGFTTFSSLALELERLLAGGHAGVGLGYAAASLVAGLLACLAGVLLGARLAPRPVPDGGAGR